MEEDEGFKRWIGIKVEGEGKGMKGVGEGGGGWEEEKDEGMIEGEGGLRGERRGMREGVSHKKA